MDIKATLFSSNNEITTQGIDLSSNSKSSSFLKSTNDELDLEKMPHADEMNADLTLPQDGKNLPESTVQVALFGEILKDNLNKMQGENALKQSDELEKSELQIVDEIDEPTITVNDFLYSEAKQISDIKQNFQHTSVNDLRPIAVKEQELLQSSNESNIPVSLAMSDSVINQDIIENKENNTNELSVKFSLKESDSSDGVNQYTEQKFNEEQNEEDHSFELFQEKNVKSKQSNELEIKKEINKALLANNASLQDKSIENDVVGNMTESDKKEVHRINEDSPINTQSISNGNEVVKKFSVQDSRHSGEGVIAKETFEQDLSEKIQLMVNAKENSATVNVDPAELGQIEIRIVQEANKTHIVFLANLEQTQDLIESNLSKLRAQMEFQGLQLGDVSVFNGSADNQQQAKTKNIYPTAHFTNNNSVDLDKVSSRSSLGMLDLYA